MINTYVLYVVMNIAGIHAGSMKTDPIVIHQEHETYNSCQVALEEFKKTKQQIVVGTCVKK